ncbi:MAG: alanine--glyoxylate aminotransferase family protein [Planctomycetota bacterium]
MGDHPVLFIPGPTEVDDELRRIMAMPLCGHRSQGFTAAVHDVCQRLKPLFHTLAHTAFETCPATALMEAGIRNLVPPGGRTLHLVAGAFGERWSKISGWCGRQPELLAAPWGSAHDPALLATRLRSGPPVSAVMITHNETSTGVLQPLRQLAAAVRETAPDALVLVDAVTSLGGAELQFDDWGIDLAFAGTQKCLALPPGLCVYALSHRAMERARSVPDRGYLFDFVRAVPDTLAGKTLATPCVPLVFALQRQLQRIEQETLEARWLRHRAMQQVCADWAREHAIEPFVAQEAARSPTVSCFQASGRDVKQMAERASDAGYKIDQGYGDLKGKTFRIGHMGDHTVDRVQACLRTML